MPCLLFVGARPLVGAPGPGPRLRRLGPLALIAAALLGPAGCAHAPRTPVSRVQMEPMKIEATPGGKAEAYDAASLFEDGNAHLKAGKNAEAAAAFDRLLAEFPGSRFSVPALYNAGLAYEGLKRFGDAAERYRRLVLLNPPGRDLLDALFRQGACLAEERRFPESEEVFTRVLARQDLGVSDRVEALARKGLAQIEQEKLEPADRTFQETIAYFRKNELVERLETDYFLAMAQYYLADLQHRRFRALPVRLPQRQLEQDLDLKARQFLIAQGRYIETIRLKNPVWAGAAGFQIGALYKEMYEVLLSAPMPPELDSDEKRQVYLELLRDKLRGLLERARRIHEKNVEMAERTGTDSDWIKRSGEQLAELERMLEAQGKGAEQPAAPPEASAPAARP